MARMLGRRAARGCPICKVEPGPDCADATKSKRQMRFAEKRSIRAEVDEEIQRFDAEREEFAYHLWLSLGRR